MSFETDIIAEIEDIVGHSRVYPLMAADDATFPYITYSFDAEDWSGHLEADADEVASSLEIKIHALSIKDAYAVADPLKKNLQQFNSDDVLSLTLDTSGDDYRYHNERYIAEHNQSWFIGHRI